MTARPIIANTREELSEALASRGEIGFVPTMGALHDGHASLLTRARSEVGESGAVVASIFVNPLQFGVGEDLDRYPRTLEADLMICADHGVDVVFVPDVTQVYPDGDPEVTINPGPKAEILEGAARPGHFAGVLTVVAKLFGLLGPDVAVFGEKDYQQLQVIRRMARDLDIPVKIVGVPTVREPDGLAKLASRTATRAARAAGRSGVLAAWSR